MCNIQKKALLIFFRMVYVPQVKELKVKPQKQPSSQLSMIYLTIKSLSLNLPLHHLFTEMDFENHKMQT